MSTIDQLATVHQSIHQSIHAGVSLVMEIVPNPPAKAPDGAAAPVASVISFLKWGVLVVIFMSALAGVGALAGGRVFGNHGASKVGVSMLVTAVGALVVYVSLYAFLTGFGAA